MIKNIGLWIDHKKAIVVTMLEEGEDIKEIRSEVEKEMETSTDGHRQCSYRTLNIYYDAVIYCIQNADLSWYLALVKQSMNLENV